MATLEQHSEATALTGIRMPTSDSGINEDEENLDEVISSCKYYSFGFQAVSEYNHSKRFTDIVSVTYNSFIQRLVILDTRGISSWSCFSGHHARCLSFPKYQTRLLQILIFSEKHRVYFAISKNFTLLVYNVDFFPICKMENLKMRSVMHAVYNAELDVLMTAGMAGTTVWKYRRMATIKLDKFRSKGYYSLVELSHHPDLGGTWCTRVILLPKTQQICFCSENDLQVYACKGFKRLLEIKNAHSGSLTSVGFCSSTKLFVTGGMDNMVKIWGLGGGLIQAFRSHLQPVTSIAIHRNGLALTSSLDGTVKVWSLHSVELFCSLNLLDRGAEAMQMIDDNLLWCANTKEVLVYKFQPVAEFWSYIKSRVLSMQMVGEVNGTGRIIAVGEDGSIRLYSPLSNRMMALCTALPPLIATTKTSITRVAYSRMNNLLYLMLNPAVLWVYSTKTDPASCDLLLLGLLDGRVLFMDQTKKFLKYFEMAVSKSPVSDIRFDPDKTRICISSRDVSNAAIKIFNLPELECTINIELDGVLTAFSFLENTFGCGYVNGFVDVINREEGESSDSGNAEAQSRTADAPPYALRHQHAIADIGACRKQRVFASCSCQDGVIKIWNMDKTLLSEITLDNSLSCALFLNNKADLLVGWKSHLYVVRRVVSSPSDKESSEDFCDPDYQVYENSSLKLEALGQSTEPEIFIKPPNVEIPGHDAKTAVVKIKRDLPSESGSTASKYSIQTLSHVYSSPPPSVASPEGFDANGNLCSYTNWNFPLLGDTPTPTAPPSVYDSLSYSGEENLESEKEEIESDEKDHETIDVATEQPASVDVIDNSEESSVELLNPVKQKKSEKFDKKLNKTQKKVTKPHADSTKELTEASNTVEIKKLDQAGVEVDFHSRSSVLFSHVPELIPPVRVKMEKQHEVKKPFVAKSCVAPNKRKSVEIMQKTVQKNVRKDLVSSSTARVQPVLIKYGAAGKEISLTKSPPILGKFEPLKKQVLNISWTDSKSIQVASNPKSSFIVDSTSRRRASASGETRDKETLGLMIEPIKHQTKPTTKEQIKEKSPEVIEVFLTRRPVKTTGPLAENETRKIVPSSKKKMNEAYGSAKKTEAAPEGERTHSLLDHFGTKLCDSDLTSIEIIDYSKPGSIPRNDGLHLDDTWQERMLERYLFLKNQRALRQRACAIKREKLDVERKYRIFARSPELAYAEQRRKDRKQTRSDVLPCFFLKETDDNAKIFSKSLPSFKLQQDQKEDNSARYLDARFHANDLELTSGFRVSFPNFQNEKSYSWKSSSRELQSRCFSAPFHSASQQSDVDNRSSAESPRLPFPDRPRSSASIPGKTRYVLVKAGSGAARSSQPTPTKLEEALLRQRFPGQHRAMLRSMEKAFNGDSMTSHSIRRDNDQPAKLSDDIRIAQSSFQLDDVTMA